MRFLPSWLAISCIARVYALQAADAGVVDWYKPLVGVPLPLPHSTTFHRTFHPDGDSRSLVLTATMSNVLAALHPTNGSVAWRHFFQNDDNVILFDKHNDVVATLSGPGGANLRLLDAGAGHLIVEQRLHHPEAGRLFEPAALGLDITFGSAPAQNDDVYVLTNGHVVRRVNTKTGEVEWGWTAPDQNSLVIYSKLVSTPTAIYAVGLAKSFASYTLHVTALSPSTGELLVSADIPSSIAGGPSAILSLNSDTAEITARVAWVEDGILKSVALTPQLTEKPTIVKESIYRHLVDVGLSAHGMFVAVKNDGSGRVVKLAADGLKIIWEFADSADAKHSADSIYTGGLDKDGYPYIARVFWSHAIRKASAHIFAPHLAEGKGLVAGFTFPFSTNDHGIITDVAMDAANPGELSVLGRFVVVTSTGAVQLWQQDQLQWTREEGLADIRVAEFVELPEKQATAHLHTGEESFGVRLKRQLAEAQDFPSYATNFARRFVTGSYATVSAPVAAPSNDSSTTSLFRDAFGFRKIIVAATTHGKVYGIDSANGEVVWSRVFGLGWAAAVGGDIIPVKLYVLSTIADGDRPQVAVVTQRRAKNTLVDTVVFHIDALTGEDARSDSKKDVLLQGEDVIAGPLVDGFLLQTDAVKAAVLFDEFLQVHLYPDNDDTNSALAAVLPAIRFPLRTGAPGQRRLMGHQIPSERDFTGKYIAYSTWSLPFSPGEDIHAIIPRTPGPVASLGKVLGNRTTLYKYLNPGLIAVVTRPSLAQPDAACGVYLLDGNKGTLLYHEVVPSFGGSCDVKAVLTENWLVYHYYDPHSDGSNDAKSYRMVSVELYEGSGIDDKTKSSELSSFSNKTTAITIFEQSFVFPRDIKTIALTSTKYGITNKDVIVANDNFQIQSFPRRFLDPRRPKGKPTAEQAEEWLIQYDPLLPDDPKRVLSHRYQVAQTRHIITSPALLESTSLVLAYGLDLFFTRVAPSNTFDVLSEDFNKLQLVLTVIGLGVGIAVTRPWVRSKKQRERWYN